MTQMSPRVSTSLPINFHEFSIPLRKFEISLLRRNNVLFPSVFYKSNTIYLATQIIESCQTFAHPLWHELPVSLAAHVLPHQTRKPFYITTCRQKNPASRENYASELHQVMIMRLLKGGSDLLRRMVSYDGRVHFILFNHILFWPLSDASQLFIRHIIL